VSNKKNRRGPSSNQASLEERRRFFFYAEDDADLYDADAELNTPRYGLLHAFLLDVIRAFLPLDAGRSMGNDLVFLDIGSGTGAEGIAIMEEFPFAQLVALDLCQPMHAIFQRKARERFGAEVEDSRLRFVVGDIADRANTLPALRKALKELTGKVRFDCVVSALTLHHLTPAEKAAAYHDICHMLKVGGTFVNADLFGFRSPSFDRIASSHSIEWIRAQHNPTTSEFPSLLRSLGDRAVWLAQKWIDHCQDCNIALPLEPGRENQRFETEGALAKFNGELESLLAAGFRAAECGYRFWQMGVVWAYR
jgi:SAM-dependent methyltransferase